jgi:Viral BACON domain
LNWSSNIGNSASWLSISPSSDHLRAHASETVTVNVQSQQLAIGSYQGTINFKGGVNPQITVFLSVVAPGNLIASPPSLNFSSIGQNPANQTVAIQNSGGVALDWTVTATTTDGANWLSATPASGFLAPNQTANVAIKINAATLKPHAYQGMLTFSYGGLTSQVPISLTVSVPPTPTIGLSQQALNFSTIKGTNPASQSFTIKNTGNAMLNWAITEDQNGATFVPVSPKSGSLASGQSTVITVAPNVTQASAGTLTASITVQDSDGGTKVANQKITVNIIVKDQAIITLSESAMTFDHSSSVTSSSQLLTITNTGSQPLNWVANSSASWLSADTMSGTLAPGADIIIDVQCDSSALSTGTYSATFIVSDSDTGTPVISQTVVVSLVVS